MSPRTEKIVLVVVLIFLLMFIMFRGQSSGSENYADPAEEKKWETWVNDQVAF